MKQDRKLVRLIARVAILGCVVLTIFAALVLWWMAIPDDDEFVKAIYANDISTIRNLIANGKAGMPARCGGSDTYPLIVAAGTLQAEYLKWLLAAGADPNCRDRNGHAAILSVLATTSPPDEREGLACLATLVASGARTDFLIDEGNGSTNALHYACGCVLPNTSEWLIAQGLDPKSIDSAGWTPLHYAAYSHRAPYEREPFRALILLLMKNGVDINARNRDGDTAFDFIKRSNHKALLDTFLRAIEEGNVMPKEK